MQSDEEKGSVGGRACLEPSQDDIERQPWKYVGYRGYTQFIASDDDLLIFRQFRDLNTRIALRLQDKVSVLEAQLKALDDTYSAKVSGPINNGSIRDDMDDRQMVLCKIEKALCRYNKFVANQFSMRQLPRAPSRDVKNIKRWHQGHDNRAIDEHEHSYLDQEDLICLSRKDKTPLRQMIDSSLRLRTLSIWRDTSRPSMDASGHVSYFSDKKMNAFVSMMIVLIGTAMLIIPIWILERQDDLEQKLIVITIFIFAFLVVLSSVMVTKPFEALGATAAYAAVLMVFIQVGS